MAPWTWWSRSPPGIATPSKKRRTERWVLGIRYWGIRWYSANTQYLIPPVTRYLLTRTVPHPTHTTRIRSLRDVAPGVRELTLSPREEPLHFKAGQWLSLNLPLGE